MPAPSDPVKVSISFGLVWAFLVAFTVSNIGKNAGLTSPNLFVSLLAGLLAGAGIGTGTYFLFDRVDHPFPVDGTGGAPQALGPDWNDQITQDYIQNQTANTEYQTTQLQQQIANKLNQTQTTSNSQTQIANQLNQTQTQTTSNSQTQTQQTAQPQPQPKPAAPPAPWTPTISNCSASGLTADQSLQCILAGYLSQSTTGTLTPYQLQQLSDESGIPVATLQTTLANITQAQAQADYQALVAAGITPKYPVPAQSCPSGTFYSAAPAGFTGYTTPGCYTANGTVLTFVSPATVATAANKKFSPRVKAAIALPIVMVGVIGILYSINRFLPAGDVAPGLAKFAFGASALSFVFTVIPAIAIGAYVSQKGGSTQMTQAALGLGGVAGVTFLITGGLGVRYGKSLFADASAIPASVPGGGFGIFGFLGLLITIGGVALLGYWGSNKNKINNANNYRNAGIAMLTIGVAIMAGSGALYKRSQTGTPVTPQTNGNAVAPVTPQTNGNAVAPVTPQTNGNAVAPVAPQTGNGVLPAPR